MPSYSGFPRYISLSLSFSAFLFVSTPSLFLSLSFRVFFIEIAPRFPCSRFIRQAGQPLLLLINVFGIPDQRCADFLFILFPLRLPLRPLGLIDCFILTGRYLSYATLHPRARSSTTPLPPPALLRRFDLRFAKLLA